MTRPRSFERNLAVTCTRRIRHELNSKRLWQHEVTTVITVVSATPHHHDKTVLEAWLKEEVTLWPLSLRKREPLTRDYLTDVTAEIRTSVEQIWPGSRVFFLVTGHAYFNVIAVQALRQRLKHPFVILVYNDTGGFEPFPTNFVFDSPLSV